MGTVARLFGSNIKVHFVNMTDIPATCYGPLIAGAKYGLFSVYPFINETKNPIKGSDQCARSICKHYKHVILDSGLFTLMFGAGKDLHIDRKYLERWQDRQIRFVKENNLTATVVEIDCQKLLGVEDAWYFRERMKDLLPNNRQINVFHVEDGKYGLDRLIEFSEYLAISVPELRITHGKDHKEHVVRLASYIKNKKPEIDIHLLGCTDKYILQRCRFCTSADSSSWASAPRFGFLKGRHTKNLNQAALSIYDNDIIRYQPEFNDTGKSSGNLKCRRMVTLCAQEHLKDYITYAGPQD